MRQKACEKLGETKKREELDAPGCSRKRKSTECLEYLQYKHDSSKENTDKQLKIREEEVKLEKQRMDVRTAEYAEINDGANENAAGITKGNVQFISNIHG